MAKYKYKALENNTTLIEGEIEADSLREARGLIRALGFIPTKIYTENAVSAQVQTMAKQDKNIVKEQIRHLSLEQKINFTSQLETLLSAGIPILEVLQSIQNNTNDNKLKTISSNLYLGVVSGLTFAQSLTGIYKNIFGSTYCSLIKTGEDAGELEVTLQRMLVMLRKQEAIKNKIKSASIYPIVLLTMMTGLLVLFSKFVFPKFAGVMAFNGADLPFLAQTIIGCFDFVNNFWWLLLMFIGAGCYGLVNLFKNSQFKRKWDDFILIIPVISDFITYINLSNFMTVMYIAYDAGVTVTASLELASETVGNHNIKLKIFNSIKMVRAGTSLTEALECSMAIPQAMISMISAGEKSGTLGKMFHDIADVIDKKVDMTLETMTKLFEPAVILIIGGAVLFIAIAFFQAYVCMLGSLF